MKTTELAEIRREITILESSLEALAEHLGVVVTPAYVDLYGYVWNKAKVREKCESCGK